jgi:biotin-dependent carboxylase-like uncharacterized protein
VSALLVTRVGPLATVQDLGRPGHARLGVTTSGAADRSALRLANRILGNDPAAAGIEVLSLGMPPTGLRSYLAVRGRLEVARVFGSASTDPTSGVGPPLLEPGTLLSISRVGSEQRCGVDDLAVTDLAAPASPAVGDLVLRVVLGPRDDWFDPASVARFTTSAWEVTADLDRVGIRLAGPPLARSRMGELASEGVVRGSVQVPPSGQPLVFLADHPTTGGYPVIGVLADEDTDALAQVRPGGRLRFRPTRPSWT